MSGGRKWGGGREGAREDSPWEEVVALCRTVSGGGDRGQEQKDEVWPGRRDGLCAERVGVGVGTSLLRGPRQAATGRFAPLTLARRREDVLSALGTFPEFPCGAMAAGANTRSRPGAESLGDLRAGPALPAIIAHRGGAESRPPTPGPAGRCPGRAGRRGSEPWLGSSPGRLPPPSGRGDPAQPTAPGPTCLPCARR